MTKRGLRRLSSRTIQLKGGDKIKLSYIIFFSIGLLAMLCICAAEQDETAGDWYKKGLDLDRNGSYEEAIKAYNRAIELEPDNATFYTALVPNLNMLAFTTNNQSRRNESLEAIDKALEIDPKSPIAWEQKGSMLYYQTKRYNKSLEAYDKAIENISSYSPDNQLNQAEFLSFIWTSKSISLWQLMRYNESLEAVDKAVQIDPSGNYDAWVFKGQILAYLGRYNESLQAFEGAASTETSKSQPEIKALPWSKEGYVLIQMGRYEDADSIYQKIVGLNFSNESAEHYLTVAWSGRGNALAKLGYYNESLQAFDRAIELNAENAPYAWTGKGDVLQASGRYDEALKAYDRALELYPKQADAGIARAQKGRGDCFTHMGKHNDALAAYGAAVEASNMAIPAFDNAAPLEKVVSFTFDPYPLDRKFWTDRGSALSILGHKEDAIQACETALAASDEALRLGRLEENAEIWQEKGVAPTALGRQAEANDALAKAKELGYEDSASYPSFY